MQYRFTVISGNLFYSVFDQLQTPTYQDPRLIITRALDIPSRCVRLKPNTMKSSFT